MPKKVATLSEFERQVAERFEEILNRRFKSVREFSNASGIAYQTLHEILNQKQRIHMGHLGKIIEGLGGEFITLFTDRKYVPEDTIPSLDDPHGTEFTAVPTVSPATCGSSGAILENEIQGFKYFDSQFLKGLKDPLLTHASGDSMYPYIQDGDLILIDRSTDSRERPDTRHFYLVDNPEISEEVAISVKRVKLCGDRLVLVPQNPSYDISEIRIKGRSLLDIVLGKVVWVGRELDVNGV